MNVRSLPVVILVWTMVIMYIAYDVDGQTNEPCNICGAGQEVGFPYVSNNNNNHDGP
jgi:hypothetical protein